MLVSARLAIGRARAIGDPSGALERLREAVALAAQAGYEDLDLEGGLALHSLDGTEEALDAIAECAARAQEMGYLPGSLEAGWVTMLFSLVGRKFSSGARKAWA